MKRVLIILFVFAVLISFISAPGTSTTTITCNSNSDCGQSSVSRYCENLQACTSEIIPTCYKNAETTEGFCGEKEGGGCTPCQYDCQNGECIAPASTICIDPDGTNHFAAGKTCIGSTCELDKCEGNTIIEYTCKDNKIVVDHTYGCANCSEGACLPLETGINIQPAPCIQRENTCCRADRCGALLACTSDSISVFKGCDANCNPISTCQPKSSEQVKEQVKCIFANSKTEQRCYLSEYNDKFFCYGKEICLIDVSGYSRQQLVWKSTCGGYGYTTVDGINDDIAFECRIQETTQTQETKPMIPYSSSAWYGIAYWQCYDKTNEKQGGGTSCKPAEVWKKYAEESCMDNCDTATGKCGVANFGVYGECSGATIVQPAVCGNSICEPGEWETCKVQADACEEGKECTASTKRCYTPCPQDCQKGKEGINAKLNEKFELQVSQLAKFKDQNLVIQFNNLFVPKCQSETSVQTSATVEKYDTMTGGVISGFPIANAPTESKNIEQKCNEAEPYAVLKIEHANKETDVIKIKLGEKKKIFNFSISFLDYKQESKSGLFLVSLETFECPENCICDIYNKNKECRKITECPENEILCPDGACREKCEINNITTECKFGCFYQDKCLPYGLRVNGLYCSINNDMKTQLAEEACENNFECKSNVCVAGKCVSEGVMKKILEWFANLFGGG